MKAVAGLRLLTIFVVVLTGCSALAQQHNLDNLSAEDKERLGKLLALEVDLEKQGYLKEAIGANLEILEILPNSAEAMTSIGGLYGQMKDFNQEIAWTQKAIVADPNHYDAYINHGNAEGELGRPELAEADFRKAMEIDPSNPLGVYGLGVLAEKESDYERAAGYYRQSVKLDSKFENGYYNLAAMESNLQHYDDATAALKKVLELNPNAADARAMLDRLNAIAYYDAYTGEMSFEHFTLLVPPGDGWKPMATLSKRLPGKQLDFYNEQLGAMAGVRDYDIGRTVASTDAEDYLITSEKEIRKNFESDGTPVYWDSKIVMHQDKMCLSIENLKHYPALGPGNHVTYNLHCLYGPGLRRMVRLIYQYSTIGEAQPQLDKGKAFFKTLRFKPDTPAAKPSAAGEIRVNAKDGLNYVWIPAGAFRMGCSTGDKKCEPNEKPPHQVMITKGFWIGQTPVTQAAYKRVADDNPSHFHGDQLPVDTVTWQEAEAYCKAVGMRLPSEAEWEYAARAGSTRPLYGDLDAIAWYANNSGNGLIDSAKLWRTDAAHFMDRLFANGGGTHPVAKKQPNAWKLYDMVGNVWEWTGDWYDEKYYHHSPQQDPLESEQPQDEILGTMLAAHVLRGGAWNEYQQLSVSARIGAPNDEMRGSNGDTGFRCAGDLQFVDPWPLR